MKGVNEKERDEVTMTFSNAKIFLLLQYSLKEEKSGYDLLNIEKINLIYQFWNELDTKSKNVILGNSFFRERMDYWGIEYQADLAKLETSITIS